MLSFTESVTISASPGVIWTHLVDFTGWWPTAHPDHIRVEFPSEDKSVAVGTPLDFEERVGGIRSVATGRIVSAQPGVEATWEGTAVYYYLGLKFPMETGLKWRLARMTADLTIVSASAWAVFPDTLAGRLLKWHAKKHLHMWERDREHMQRELNALKDVVEGDGNGEWLKMSAPPRTQGPWHAKMSPSISR